MSAIVATCKGCKQRMFMHNPPTEVDLVAVASHLRGEGLKAADDLDLDEWVPDHPHRKPEDSGIEK